MTLRPIAGRAFAERVRDEMAAAWLAGEPDAIPPVQLRPPGERQAELAAIAAQAARYHAARAAEFDEARRAELAADAGRQAALRELVGDAGVAASLGAAAPNLDSEGISQHVHRVRLDSLNSPATAGALALVEQPNRAARRRSDDPHAGHKCCGDETLPYGASTLVGRRIVYDADEDAGTFRRDREALTFALKCRRWRCPCCKWRLRKRNRARAIRGALGTGRTWFVTITLDRSTARYRAFDASLRDRHGGIREAGGRLLTGAQAATLVSIKWAAACWNRLRTMLVRHYGRRIEYYKALEIHPGAGANGGAAHVHLLIRTGSLQEWFMRYGGWRRLLTRAGFGVVTKVELVRDRQAAAHYVTKMTAAYTSKDMAELPRWTRRGAWSRDWCAWTKATPIAGFAWQLARAPEDAIRDALTATGFALLDPADFRVPAAGP